MIPHFSDHAANERTYLAWVRTALAVVGLGFLLERFDLFLAYLGHEEAARAQHHMHLRTTEWIGLLLIGFGSVMIFFATVRFVQQRRDIAVPETVHYRNSAAARSARAICSSNAQPAIIHVPRKQRPACPHRRSKS